MGTQIDLCGIFLQKLLKQEKLLKGASLKLAKILGRNNLIILSLSPSLVKLVFIHYGK